MTRRRLVRALAALAIAGAASCISRRPPNPPASAPALAPAPAVVADSAPPWPKTVAEAVQLTLAGKMNVDVETLKRIAREQVPNLLHGYQMRARYAFGLNEGNTALLRSCGRVDMVLEDCLLVILDAAWVEVHR